MENIIDAATKRDKARRVLAFLASSGADTLAAFGAIGYQRLAEMPVEVLDDLILAAWHSYCGEAA